MAERLTDVELDLLLRDVLKKASERSAVRAVEIVELKFKNAKLRKYVQHKNRCEVRCLRDHGDCTCGLDDALARKDAT